MWSSCRLRQVHRKPPYLNATLPAAETCLWYLARCFDYYFHTLSIFSNKETTSVTQVCVCVHRVWSGRAVGHIGATSATACVLAWVARIWVRKSGAAFVWAIVYRQAAWCKWLKRQQRRHWWQWWWRWRANERLQIYLRAQTFFVGHSSHHHHHHRWWWRWCRCCCRYCCYFLLSFLICCYGLHVMATEFMSTITTFLLLLLPLSVPGCMCVELKTFFFPLEIHEMKSRC